jgi:hypothetical protein
MITARIPTLPAVIKGYFRLPGGKVYTPTIER